MQEWLQRSFFHHKIKISVRRFSKQMVFFYDSRHFDSKKSVQQCKTQPRLTSVNTAASVLPTVYMMWSKLSLICHCHWLLCFLLKNFSSHSICSLCTKDISPLTFQACVMPKDCQTSHWSSWSSCSKTCRSTDLSPGYRLRTRTMTQIPVGGGKRCPALEEKEACNIIGDLLPNCPR